MLLRLTISLIVLLSGFKAARAEFVTALLETGRETVREIHVTDLTGDGVAEIVAFTVGEEGPGIHVFSSRPEGPGPHPALAVLHPASEGHKEIYYALLVRLSAGGKREILLADRTHGVSAFPLVENEEGRPIFGEPRWVFDCPTLPFYPDPTRFPVLDTAFDLDGDGKDEALLPAADGYRIAGAPEDRASIPTGVTSKLETAPHRFMTLGTSIPRLTPMDWDGDGRIDFACVRRGTFQLFLQRDNGSFLTASRPVDALKPGPIGSDRATPLLGDVDADGRTDFLLTLSPSSVGLFERFSSRQSLFLNPHILSVETPGRLATPRVTVKTEGISINPVLTDFDGDGDLDLVVTSLGLDMKSRIRKSVTADYLLFRFDAKKRTFERDPYFKTSRPFPMAQLERNSTAPVCFFTGDFDGDGKRDLLNIADEGHLTIQKGTTETGFLSSARFEFDDTLFRAKASVGNDLVIEDFTGDGISDLAAFEGSRIFLIRSEP
jgi:FG-GAP-like repeat